MGHTGQIPATFCSNLPDDAIGKRQGRMENAKKELISLLWECGRHSLPFGKKFP